MTELKVEKLMTMYIKKTRCRGNFKYHEQVVSKYVKILSKP